MGMAAAVIGGAVIGGVASNSAASKGAKAQKYAADTATQAQMEMYDTTQENLKPYMDFGKSSVNMLTDQLPALTKPVVMDQMALQGTPGYKFTLRQGLKAAQNSAAARGLGVSGASYKGATDFATGLANSTYQQQFNNAVTNQQNTYNRLLSAAGLGENAAAGLGNNAVTTGQGVAQNTIGAGNAAAANYVSQGNSYASMANSVPNSMMASQSGMYGGGGGSSSSSSAGGGASPGPTNFGPMGMETWSDIRLKENIIPLGQENGYPIYEFSYKGDPDKYIGVMAQDILELMPEAVREQDGYFAVNYSKLGVSFRRVN